MPGLSPIQPSFHAGEVDAAGRVDLDIFKYGLAECTNFRPKAKGSLLMRAGSETKGFITLPTNERYIRFRMSDQQDYLLDLTDHLMVINDISGLAQAIDIGTVDLIQNGGFDSGIAWGGNGVISGGLCDLTGGLNKTQTLNVTAAGTYKLKVRTAYLATGYTGGIWIGWTPGGAQVLQQGVYFGTASGSPHTGWTEVNVVFASPGTYYLQFNGPALVWSIDDVSLTYTAGAGVFSVVTPWTAAQLSEIHYTTETGRDSMIFVHKGTTPQSLTRGSNGIWTFGPVIFVPANPADWATIGYPETVEVSNARAFYAVKNHIWGTTVGTINDLNSDPTKPNSAIDFKLATAGSIRWLRGNRKLLAGTDIGVHVITGSQNPPMNGDTQALEQEYVGSAKVQAVNVGSKAIFVSTDRRDIRSIVYDRDSDGWVSDSIALFAQQMTAGLIKEIHHVRTPEPLVVLLMQTGEVIAVEHDPAKKTAAWWRVNVGAVVTTCAVSTGPLGAYLWVAATRNGKSVKERIPLTDLDANGYLDSSVRGLSDGSGWLYGLGHLEGQTVRVCVDGQAWYSDQTVLGGGVNVSGDFGNRWVVAGLPYTARAKTLPVEGGNPAGTSQGLNVHWSEVVARLTSSYLPLINGERALTGKPFDVGAEVEGALTTGDVRVTGLEAAEGGQITIVQDKPYRTEVNALFGQAEVSKV